jgi:hypothetical protein
MKGSVLDSDYGVSACRDVIVIQAVSVVAESRDVGDIEALPRRL